MEDSYLVKASLLSHEIVELQERLETLNECLDKLKAEHNLIVCPICKAILKDDQLCSGNYTTTSTETVYTDCAYGENDEIAEVTFYHMVKRCPNCGREISRRKWKLGETNRRPRA